MHDQMITIRTPTHSNLPFYLHSSSDVLHYSATLILTRCVCLSVHKLNAKYLGNYNCESSKHKDYNCRRWSISHEHTSPDIQHFFHEERSPFGE